jgi:hypothetical protein
MKMTETRSHHKITVAVFGRKKDGSVDKDIIHTVELFTGTNREGFIESVHDRMRRFAEEASGTIVVNGRPVPDPEGSPAYQISSVEVVD